MARQHHDYQREGNPVGYYVPGMDAKIEGGNTLILTHTDVVVPEISLHKLISDRMIEVDWEGNIVWEWCIHDHFDELGFDEAAKNAIARNPNLVKNGLGDWMHINCMSVLGPNKWYDAGDERLLLTTSSSTAARPHHRILGTKRPASSSGSSAPTTQPARPQRSARSSASTTPT